MASRAMCMLDNGRYRDLSGGKKMVSAPPHHVIYCTFRLVQDPPRRAQPTHVVKHFG